MPKRKKKIAVLFATAHQAYVQMLKGIDGLDFADISQTALAVGGLYEVAQRAVYTLCAVAYAMDLQMTGFNWQDAMELGNDIATRLGLPQLD